MKPSGWLVRSFVISSVLSCCVLPAATAINIDVEMRLNDSGFISFDHFKAELCMNNLGEMAPGATIFGILEVLGEYFFWPSFSEDVDFEIHDIDLGESHVVFLEFDFEDIDEFIPFGPMVFWGAWFLDIDTWNYDFQHFWLDSAHKWTPTPSPTPTRTPTPTLKPGDLFATDLIVGNMRFVPAGTFTQGSPNTEPCRGSDEAQFTHILTRNLAVMETEVSRQMWASLKAVQGTLPDDPSNTYYSPTLNHPVQRNTWYESVLFANLLSLQNGFTRCYYTDAGYTIPVTASNYTTGPFYCNFNANGYRLPTEGEWEYFARAGARGPFSCDEPDYNSRNCETCIVGTHPTLEQYCVYCANSFEETVVVGSKLANPWNLKDVHGNVVEWCWDWIESYPTGTVTDYVGSVSGFRRIVRGGSWRFRAVHCRSANRNAVNPVRAYDYLGLRIVRAVRELPQHPPSAL